MTTTEAIKESEKILQKQYEQKNYKIVNSDWRLMIYVLDELIIEAVKDEMYTVYCNNSSYQVLLKRDNQVALYNILTEYACTPIEEREKNIKKTVDKNQ